MKKVSLSGSPRENVGKKDAKALRKQGNVPCVVYGSKEGQIHFWTAEKNFKNIIFTPETKIVELDINGQKIDSILQDVQYHPVTDRILHADFLQIFPDKKVVVSVPVNVFGNSPGVMKGGKLIKKFRKLKVKALPAHLPEKVDINIDNLDIGMAIKVGDLAIDNVEFLDNKNSIVVAVKVTRNVVEETTTEGGAAPASSGGAAPAPAATPAKK